MQLINSLHDITLFSLQNVNKLWRRNVVFIILLVLWQFINAAAGMALGEAMDRQRRTWWRISSSYLQELSSQDVSGPKNFLRMAFQSFNKVLQMLSQDTHFRCSFTVEKRLAMTLRFLVARTVTWYVFNILALIRT